MDYFHRLTKGNNIFLKVATIKHRTRTYYQHDGSYVGVEVGHDIHDIDMDYTLDKFDDLKNFMQLLLKKAADECSVEIDFDEIFAGEGFSQLCLASGGVPRDFLSLFVKLASQYTSEEIERIGKIEVNEAAIANINNKFKSLITDSEEEREILEEYLSAIKDYVYSEERTNTFLVAKPELDDYPQERQAIKELVDLRLLHLIENNTSKAPSDGRRYEAYLIDVGLYENSRPRNFTQIEPGLKDDKSRKDKLRASPYLDLKKLNDLVFKIGKQLDLSYKN